MSSKAIPVYLFLGFLEGGKTKFIQETISNKRFGLDENILIVICEEGIEEYDISQFGGKSITLHTIVDKSELDEQTLLKLSDECDADKILIEYNGKTVKFKAIISSRPELPNNVFAVGRFIMTCCEADMEFCWFVSLYNQYYNVRGEKWVTVTAEITVQHHETENIDIPLLRITDLYECEPPEKAIASFL